MPFPTVIELEDTTKIEDIPKNRPIQSIFA
jgi:hypothetical protein